MYRLLLLAAITDVYAGGAASALCKASLFIFDLIRRINRLICIVYLLI